MKCENCRKLMVVQAMGIGKVCGHSVSSMAYSRCTKCAVKDSKCMLCGADMKGIK